VVLIFGCKKGNVILEVIMGVLILLVIIVGATFAKFILNEVTVDVVADPDTHNETKAVLEDWNDKYVGFMDGIFMFVLVLFWILLLVSSFTTDTHPIFFVVMVIVMVFGFIVVAYIGNLYSDIASDPAFSTISTSFSMGYWVMTHILQTAIIIAFSVILTLFAKNRYFSE